MDASPPLSVTTIYVLEGGRGGVNSCPLSIKKRLWNIIIIELLY